MEEIMDEQSDSEVPKPKREGMSRPNKRKSTSRKKSAVQSKMEMLRARLFPSTKSTNTTPDIQDSPPLCSTGGPDQVVIDKL